MSPAPDRHHTVRVDATEAFVKQRIAGHDSSHDWWHIHRVRNMALVLAASEALAPTERCLAELAALVHDVADHNADPAADRGALQHFLAGLGLAQQERDLVLYVVDNLGFKEELARQAQQGCSGGSGTSSNGDGAGGGGDEAAAKQRVLAVVQDADRLDAIGAIGIARCLTFGGSFGRVLHDPAIQPRAQLTQQQYTDKAAQATTMNHFHEKLFKLKDLMRTAAGREMAEARHAYMQGFVERFQNEWNGAA